MTNPHSNGHSNGDAHVPDAKGAGESALNGTGIGALIEEAQSLKDVLHDVYGRSARLVVALKRQRKQNRLMSGALATLRQLQKL